MDTFASSRILDTSRHRAVVWFERCGFLPWCSRSSEIIISMLPLCNALVSCIVVLGCSSLAWPPTCYCSSKWHATWVRCGRPVVCSYSLNRPGTHRSSILEGIQGLVTATVAAGGGCSGRKKGELKDKSVRKPKRTAVTTPTGGGLIEATPLHKKRSSSINRKKKSCVGRWSKRWIGT